MQTWDINADALRLSLCVTSCARGTARSVDVGQLQVACAGVPLKEICDNDALAPPSLRVGVSRGRAPQRSSLAQGGGQTQVECPMGLTHSQELTPFTAREHLPSSNPIQGHAPEHERRPKSVAVFQHHHEVVSEVQVGLERAGRLQRAPPRWRTLTVPTHPTRLPSFFSRQHRSISSMWANSEPSKPLACSQASFRMKKQAPEAQNTSRFWANHASTGSTLSNSRPKQKG